MLRDVAVILQAAQIFAQRLNLSCANKQCAIQKMHQSGARLGCLQKMLITSEYFFCPNYFRR